MKVVLILSGGVDSSTLLYYLLHKGYSIHALTFIYGQKHSKEIDCAKKVTEHASRIGPVIHKIVDISSIHELISKGAITGDDEIPEGYYTEDKQRLTIVPNRNMILLSIAAGYAVKLGLREVYYAAHKSDCMYPDCRKEFIKAMDTAIYLANIWEPVELKAPFIDMKKVEIVSLGLQLGVPYELTWSCYSGGERPCLKCGTCVERTEAFILNNSRDPLLSEIEWKRAVEILEEFKNRNITRI
ncbi:MAG: 7-cyano-7-deazaguanine synthase QueC [Archaeoglobaceae archaeon]|nr:7-cyano-7-deazaguanine synthase QueC [Archaeoglobaceae archaeon]MDW7989664.1 7-cyano-7-deazaguanine synthase QueC [Archaeoglobaceae archaeon]